MRISYLLSFSALMVAGCTNTTLPKSDKYQMEITLHKTRADIEEIKHDLHSHKMETSILEGKMLNQEDSMAALKKETYDQHQAKLDQFAHQIAFIEKKLSALEKEQEELLHGQQRLTHTTQEMHRAIAQSKEKINEMEKAIAQANKSVGEVAKLRKPMQQADQEHPIPLTSR